MEPKLFYESAIAEHQVQLSHLKRLSLLLSMLRLTVFFGIFGGIYLVFENSMAVAIVAVVGISVFLFLVSYNANVKNKRDFKHELVSINERELRVLDRNLNGIDSGEEFVFENHHYNQDIDLFGEGSLFQLINRSGTKNGRITIANWLNSNDITEIDKKQAAIKELEEKVEWRQDFEATGRIIEKEVESDRIVKWIKAYERKIPKAFKFIPWSFSILSVIAIGLWAGGIIPGFYLGVWFFLGLQITAAYLKKINKLYKECGKMQETFQQYSRLILAIENEDFTEDLLKKQQTKLTTGDVIASQSLADLSKIISNLDQRNNVFFGVIANGFFLWDLRHCFAIEKWMNETETAIDEWFDAVSFFDATNSLANFSFNQIDYVFPELSQEKKDMLDAKDLGHPLLSSEKRIDNSIFMKDEDFYIITGANMAGKSTFLRTVALNIVMANCGLPVCAKSFKYKPIKLISSMRTSDSLQNDESYFFSELKRLKFIVDQIQTDTFFIILDEILKGTNSKDKAEGSQKFVERLVASNSTGLIATHDLSLCTLSDKLPQVENKYFDAEIVDDELYFDYTFKEGVCQNMNASFLLKKMEIV